MFLPGRKSPISRCLRAVILPVPGMISAGMTKEAIVTSGLETVSVVTLDYARGAEFDTGRFVARYIQVLAWMSIASIITRAMIFDALHLNPSPVFLFWAASALKRRSRTARKWVLWIAGLTLLALIVVDVLTILLGTDGMVLTLGPRRIMNPPIWQALLVSIPIAVAAGIPFVILLSERARRQFGVGVDS